MRLNGYFLALLFLSVLFLAPSCSLSKRTTYPKNDRTSVEEYEAKLYGKKKKKKEALAKDDKKDPKMPDAVDISDYDPGFGKDKKDAPEVIAAEVKLRNDMVEFGKQYLGVPYKYAGSKPSTGFDCSGFTCYIYQNFGLQLSRASRYQANEGKKIDAKKTLPGDLIIFGNKGKINHVGMVVDNNKEGIYVIHSTNRGVVIDNILKSNYWKPRMMYGRRVVGK